MPSICGILQFYCKPPEHSKFTVLPAIIQQSLRRSRSPVKRECHSVVATLSCQDVGCHVISSTASAVRPRHILHPSHPSHPSVDVVESPHCNSHKSWKENEFAGYIHCMVFIAWSARCLFYCVLEIRLMLLFIFVS